MATNKILALDISSRSLGWAVGNGTTNGTTSGVQSFSEHTVDYGRLFASYEAWLQTQINLYSPTHIIMEGTNNMLKGNARYLLTTMSGITHKVAWANKLPRREYAPATIKKFLTGNARASKEDMIEAVHKLGFTKVTIDDEADAIGILLLGIKHLKG